MNIPRVAVAPIERNRQFWKDAASQLRSLFGRPPRLQFGALCYRTSGEGRKGKIEVLLITSRETGRWVIPKGWPMEGRAPFEVASREAYEEAGMCGKAVAAPIGHFAYGKTLKNGLTVRCIVQVHAMEVKNCKKDFPERGQRRLCWMTPQEAADRVDEPALKAIFAAFSPRNG